MTIGKKTSPRKGSADAKGDTPEQSACRFVAFMDSPKPDFITDALVDAIDNAARAHGLTSLDFSEPIEMQIEIVSELFAAVPPLWSQRGRERGEAVSTASAGSNRPEALSGDDVRELARRIILRQPSESKSAGRALVAAITYLRDARSGDRFDFFNYFLMELAPYLDGYEEMLEETSRKGIAEARARTETD